MCFFHWPSNIQGLPTSRCRLFQRLILRFGFAAKKVDEAPGRMVAFGLGVVQVICSNTSQAQHLLALTNGHWPISMRTNRS